MEHGQVHVAHHQSHCDHPEHDVDVLDPVGVDLGGQPKERDARYETGRGRIRV